VLDLAMYRPLPNFVVSDPPKFDEQTIGFIASPFYITLTYSKNRENKGYEQNTVIGWFFIPFGPAGYVWMHPLGRGSQCRQHEPGAS
jgi:hypothetical protein